MNTCVITEDEQLNIISKRQHRLLHEYAYKKRRYATDPEYRRKMIDRATEWRRQNNYKKLEESKRPKFKIEVRRNGEMVTAFELLY